MHQLFEAAETDALLPVDVYRLVALRNIYFVCPEIVTFVFRAAEIASCEGTTQGDPLAMPHHILAVTSNERDSGISKTSVVSR
jgi:hypothetical protein